MSKRLRTSLLHEEFETVLQPAFRAINRDGKLINRTLREATGLNYDQAIHFFGLATVRGHFGRRGRAGGVHYVACAARGNE